MKYTPHQPYYFDLRTFVNMHSLFPLEEKELRAIIKKRKGAPKGKLREFYCCRNNRELITKVARELFFTIIYDVIAGNTFYFPNSRTAKIHIAPLPDWYLQHKRKLGFYKHIDLSIWNYKLPTIRVKTSRRDEDYLITVNHEMFAMLTEIWMTGAKIGGDNPKRLKDYLPDLYEKFPYISEASMKYITSTFMKNLKLGIEGGAKIKIQGVVEWMLLHPLKAHQSRNYFEWWRKNEVIKKINRLKQEQLAKEQKEIYNAPIS